MGRTYFQIACFDAHTLFDLHDTQTFDANLLRKTHHVYRSALYCFVFQYQTNDNFDGRKNHLMIMTT